MQASNRPTVAADAPQRSYADVVAGRNLQPASVARGLHTSAPAAGWQDTFEVSRKAAEDAENSAQHAKDLLGGYADSLVPMHFLVVTGNQVRVLYGLRTCRPLDREGRRYAALIGERGGTVACPIPPKLYITKEDNQRQYQYQTFQRASKNAQSFGDIQTALAADEAVMFVPEAVAAEDGEAPQAVSVWRILPVHSRVAVLFLKGMTVRAAFTLAAELYASIPEDDKQWTEPLLEYMRVAITASNDAANSSALETEWRLVNREPRLT